jgi:hypothetical protein
MKIEVSNGEIIDKLTILEIKLSRIAEPCKLAHVRKEWDALYEASRSIIGRDHPLYQELISINQKLWDIEDQIRELEKKKEFDQPFIKLARAVYFTNDQRAETKRKINELTGSNLMEVKSYEDYQ